MSLFRVDADKLIPIRNKDVKLERDIQRLIENNMSTVFGLKFISTEFQLNSLRIDSLAYDYENRCFVVVEYKKDKSSSVVDQGYAYLALVLNNKADFVLEYNDKTKSSLTKNDFDWTATRVIFVASRFTPHQLGAINFRDLPIELWETRLYEGNLLSLEQKTADGQAASIKTITKKQSNGEDVVKQEIRTYTVDDLFPESHQKQRAIFDEIDEGIKSLDESISEKPTKYYIGYRIGSDWRIFVSLVPIRDGVRIQLTRTQPKDVADPEKKVIYEANSIRYYNQHMSNMIIKDDANVEYALSVVRQVYKRHLEEYGQ